MREPSHIRGHIRWRGKPVDKFNTNTTASHSLTQVFTLSSLLAHLRCVLYSPLPGSARANKIPEHQSVKMQITAIAAAMVAAASVVSADILTILVIPRAHHPASPPPGHLLTHSSPATARSHRLHGAHQRHLALQQRPAPQHPRQHWMLGQPGTRRCRHLLRLEQEARPLLWRTREEPQALLL